MDKQILANTLRVLSCEMVEAAGAGHPGMPLGFADVMVALLYNIKFDATDLNWVNRDRVVFSCGHGCALWYSVLFGFGLRNQQDLKNFRQLHSNTPGHLELGDGVDLTTGPLGMGFAWAVGLACAERLLREKGESIASEKIDHHTYIICSDGDLMEGVSYEAAAIAGHYKLNKLIALWDDNEITIDGSANKSRTENMEQRFLSCNWNFIKCDGHSISEVEFAIKQAKNSDKPTMIACKTKIGRYSQLENTSKVHGSPLGAELLSDLKNKLEYDENLIEFKKAFQEISLQAKSGKKSFQHKKSDLSLTKTSQLHQKLSENFATRKHSENILDHMLKTNPNLIIASADLSSSCGTAPASGKLITPDDFTGNIFPCGVRENAMVAIMGGITLHSSLRGVASTFLTFYDYARPAIRLSALMNVPLLMIATHDSVELGEDGPTHQPIEHLDSLRCMPNLLVARPADGFETFFCYEQIFQHTGPSMLVLSRQNVKSVHDDFIANINDFVFEKDVVENGIIIASGAQVQLAISVAKNLNKTAISLPFLPVLNCDKYFFAEFLKLSHEIDIVEAASAITWRYYFPTAQIHNITKFGESGKAADLLKYFAFTKDDLTKKISAKKFNDFDS